MLELLYVLSMSIIDSPALFDPALFWGVVLVIFFCFHKSRKGKKEKEGFGAWRNLSRNGHDLFSFFLRGFYENKPSHPALREKTINDQKLTPNPLRVFAPSREHITLPVIRCCPSVFSREGTKARSTGFEVSAKPRQTLPLLEESAILLPAKYPKNWRRDRDSNPGYRCRHAAFRVRCFRPLSHLSAMKRARSLGVVSCVS
jgi:hypothetical protein